MPIRAKRVCPRCGGTSCEHGLKRPTDKRPSAAARGYDYRWQKVRRIILSESPLCADPFREHELNKQVVLAEEVHHVVPLSSGRPLRELNARSNLVPMCKSCHSRVTAKETHRDRQVVA